MYTFICVKVDFATNFEKEKVSNPLLFSVKVSFATHLNVKKVKIFTFLLSCKTFTLFM